MLADKKPIQGLDLSEVFSTMLKELPWQNLRAYIQSNAQLLKRCTIGGHRLDAKRRERFEKLLLKEAEKAEFSEAFCNAIFVHWYPVHAELHKALEDYFHSDEYKEYREENELEEDDYVLPDEMFNKVFNIEDLEQWRVLLCFSPLQLTEEQAKEITDDTQGNTELLRRIRELEEKQEELEREKARMASENDQLRNQNEQSTNAAQQMRKEQRKLKAKSEGLDKKLEISQAENKRLDENLKKLQTEHKELRKSLANKIKKSSARLRNEVKRLEEQIANWETKYEQQRIESRHLAKKLEESQATLKAKEKTVDERDEALALHSSFADLVLGKLDWPKVGRQMKLTPSLKSNFNSLVRKLNYEEDRTLTIDGSMEEFWWALMETEKQLVENIAQSHTREVVSGDVEEFWRELTDMFEDVRIGLEARTVLLKMLHEIFYQVLEMEDLEQPKLAKSPRKRKSSK